MKRLEYGPIAFLLGLGGACVLVGVVYLLGLLSRPILHHILPSESVPPVIAAGFIMLSTLGIVSGILLIIGFAVTDIYNACIKEEGK
jgi:hypothetical protein